MLFLKSVLIDLERQFGGSTKMIDFDFFRSTLAMKWISHRGERNGKRLTLSKKDRGEARDRLARVGRDGAHIVLFITLSPTSMSVIE